MNSTPSGIPALGGTPAFGGKSSTGTKGAELHALLATGIAGLEPLGTTRLAEPIGDPDDDVVPIDDLLFRGKDALRQALSLGDRLRAVSDPPDSEALAELLDLLQLAAAD